MALSLANLWAHCVGYARFRRRVTLAYPMRTLWAAYAALSVNAWVWSAVFHCRDTRPTEVLDYFSADCLVVFTLFAVTVRAGRLFTAWQWTPLALPLLCGLGLHFRYMLFTLFDYGFNVKARPGSSCAVMLMHARRLTRPRNTFALNRCASLLAPCTRSSCWHGRSPPRTLGG